MKAEELAALGHHKMAKVFDVMLLLALIGFFTVIPHVSRMLYMGDWDFWVDWKDKLWLAHRRPERRHVGDRGGPLSGLVLSAPAAGCHVYRSVRFDWAWLSRIFSFYGLEYYPLNFVWPATTIPMALALDLILFWSRSYLVTSLFADFYGGFSFIPSTG